MFIIKYGDHYFDVVGRFVNRKGVLFWRDRRDGEKGSSQPGEFWKLQAPRS